MFVAPSGADTNDGTQAHPSLTIGAAVARASSSGRAAVFVAAGTYGETVTLSSGVSLYGGYDPASWARTFSAESTIQQSLASGGSVTAFIARNVATRTVVSHVTIPALASSSPGVSPIAALVVSGGAGGPSFAIYRLGTTLDPAGNTLAHGAGGAGGASSRPGTAGSSGATN